VLLPRLVAEAVGEPEEVAARESALVSLEASRSANTAAATTVENSSAQIALDRTIPRGFGIDP
jgi:hypothetical protein